jgi:hypothetical protein
MREKVCVPIGQKGKPTAEEALRVVGNLLMPDGKLT